MIAFFHLTLKNTGMQLLKCFLVAFFFFCRVLQGGTYHGIYMRCCMFGIKNCRLNLHFCPEKKYTYSFGIFSTCQVPFILETLCCAFHVLIPWQHFWMCSKWLLARNELSPERASVSGIWIQSLVLCCPMCQHSVQLPLLRRTAPAIIAELQ